MSKIDGNTYGGAIHGLTVFRIDAEGAGDGDTVEFVIFNGTASQRIRLPMSDAVAIAEDLTKLVA